MNFNARQMNLSISDIQDKKQTHYNSRLSENLIDTNLKLK